MTAVDHMTELESFLEEYPETRYLEVMAPDISGVLRGKRVERADFSKLFGKGVNHCGGTTLLNIKGEVPEYVDFPGPASRPPSA